MDGTVRRSSPWGGGIEFLEGRTLLTAAAWLPVRLHAAERIVSAAEKSTGGSRTTGAVLGREEAARETFSAAETAISERTRLLAVESQTRVRAETPSSLGAASSRREVVLEKTGGSEVAQPPESDDSADSGDPSDDDAAPAFPGDWVDPTTSTDRFGERRLGVKRSESVWSVWGAPRPVNGAVPDLQIPASLAWRGAVPLRPRREPAQPIATERSAAGSNGTGGGAEPLQVSVAFGSWAALEFEVGRFLSAVAPLRRTRALVAGGLNLPTWLALTAVSVAIHEGVRGRFRRVRRWRMNQGLQAPEPDSSVGPWPEGVR